MTEPVLKPGHQPPADALVLFGATGDLAKRKLIPGLLHLFQSRLVDDLRIVGTSLDEISPDEFRDLALVAIREHSTREMGDADWREFAQRLDFVDEPRGPHPLHPRIEQRDQGFPVDRRREDAGVRMPELRRLGEGSPVRLAALRQHRLIRHSTRPHGWDHWFRTVGLAATDLHWGPSLEHFFMIIQAAVAGLGVALVPRFLVDEQLRNGQLVAPFPDRVAGPGAYYLVTPATKADLPRVRLFRQWILAEVAA